MAPLGGCHRIAGNEPVFGYWDFDVRDGVLQADSLRIDLQEKTYALTDGGNGGEQSSVVVTGGTAPRYIIDTAEGYEGIVSHLENCSLDSESSVIYCQGFLRGDSVYGICNVYKDTVGYLSGGGNYAVEEISHSLLFRYEAATDEFTVTARVDGAMAVAFSGDTVLYWKDRNYYSHVFGTDEETLLFEDKAYDTGIQHQSRARIFYNEQYAVFELVKAKGDTEIRYCYLYDFAQSQVYALNCEE